ncbi:MAG: glycosyltransferase family 4 protein [Chloroflexi bacterium]|nr:glycosyltransferase family 4 protein [Chloroflexota bacterium]
MTSTAVAAIPACETGLTSSARQSLRVLTVMACGRNETSGMPVANASISNAMRALGSTVDHLYLDDYPSVVRRSSFRYPLFGAATVARVRRAEARHGPFDVIQISGGDGYIAPLLRCDSSGRRRLIVARSHGLEHRYWQAFLREVDAGRLRTTLRHRLHFGKLRLKQTELSIRAADLLNCHTQADADVAIDRCWKRPEQALVLPGGIEPDWLGIVQPSTGRPRRLLFCGSWTWMKGAHVLARVFDRLATRDPQLTLTILGAGSDEASVLRSFHPAVRSRVAVRAQLPHGKVLEEFRRHDLLIATSLFEGFGTAVLEAMAAGLPVVASAVGTASEYIDDARSGYLVDPGDAEGFVAACESLIASAPAARVAMTRAAMEAVSGITWPNVAARTIDAYAAAAARVAELR